MPVEHPARRAGLLSQQHASERNREAWLALFAEDAVLEDPVGSVYNRLPGGDRETRADGVFVYRVNDEGKLVSLRAFWEWQRPVLDADLHPPVGRER